jgi:hypothetical protein
MIDMQPNESETGVLPRGISMCPMRSIYLVFLYSLGLPAMSACMHPSLSARGLKYPPVQLSLRASVRLDCRTPSRDHLIPCQEDGDLADLAHVVLEYMVIPYSSFNRNF